MTGKPVLEAVLSERERRMERRGALAAEYGGTVVQFTTVVPGELKDGDDMRTVARYAKDAIEAAFAERGMRVAHGETLDGAAGPCWVRVVEAKAALVKNVAIGLKNGYSLGRL